MRSILKFCFSACLLLCFAGVQAQIVYNFPGFNGSVQCTAEDANYVYIGGDFNLGSDYSQISQGMLVVSTTGTGSEDTGFPAFNGNVNAIASDGNGGWFIGGGFTKVGTFTRNRLVHILADKTVDPTWNPNANGIVTSLVVSGTDMYVGGDFTSIGGQTRNRIAKISTATAFADASWNPNANGIVTSLVVSGTDLYVGGDFTSIGGQTRNHIAKINTATALADASWNPNADYYVNSLILSGAQLYVGGYFNNIGGQSRNAVARLSTTGTGAADTWNPDAGSLGNVFSLALSGTDLYIGGSITTSGGLTRNNIAKVSTTGTGATDASWNPNASSQVNSLALSGTDLYVSGSFATIGGQNRGALPESLPPEQGRRMQPGEVIIIQCRVLQETAYWYRAVWYL